jgi:pyrophosphatase PpaX
MYRYVLFDFDGTLIDTNELIIAALKETAKRFINRDLTQDDLNSILGKYLDEQMKYLCEAQYRQMSEYYSSYYRENQDRMVKEFPGVRDMHADLKKLGVENAIVSAKEPRGIEHGLNLFNLSDYVDVIISAHDIQNNKPHPEPALKALEAFGAKPDQALLVGDSPYDILCGRNAGVKSVLVDWTIFPRQDILNLEPDFCIKKPEDLISIVKSGKLQL